MGKKYSHLTYNKRLKMDVMLRHGHSAKEIAAELDVHISTVYREKKRSSYIHTNSNLTEEERYNPDGAQERYEKFLTEKGRGLKVGNDMKFINFVEKKILEEKYSPAAVIYYIKRNPEEIDFPTRVCLSTLYNYIRGDVFLNVCMADCPIPRKRKTEKKQKVQKRVMRGKSIEDRPKIVAENIQLGHWEMDTVVGSRGDSKKTLLVLTERMSLREIIEPLKNRTAKEVVMALNRIERDMGEKTFRETFQTITVDNGVEFSDIEGIESSRRNKKNRTKLYHCHPYSSWERGRNENQNRFVRRFVPKGTNFDDITRKEVKEIEHWMNRYPRRMFGGLTAEEVYKKLCQGERKEELVA